MNTSTWAWIVLAIIVIVGGWYVIQNKNSSGTKTSAPSTALGIDGSTNQTNTGRAAVPSVVTVAHDATLGDHLVAANGMTLYRYTKDATGVSNCYGTCAVNWPPYLHATAEPLVAGEGVQGMLSTVTRTDGTEMVAYNGLPLYFWKNDVKPGDTTGQNVGGVWFVVKP